ncbi:MAG: hypothetical protein UV80_C0001G0058 [Candidatus Peregrinibacteria bacterium GW2011_GWF2_43_17]|nr:MAG: hypothetical protein UV80_C0001G0058 [Candidatus Peregrinibacteria bacterium GW2011_GWF2_43_17]KKT20495.1 MAG: hypothetical protein UW03_C0003G0031 [Candidatus Peregrinibacteria bacterium GW2011_GWA2_43_8]HAU40300.1 hypothetical protein [Candidatus Peregrinibacteria bacterium]
MKKILIAITTLVLLLPLCKTAFAAYEVPEEYQPSNIAESRADQNESTEGGDYGATAVTYVLADLVSGLLGIVGVIAVYFLVANALSYASSFGQQDKIDKAKKGIMWSIAGLLIIMLSYSIVRFVIRVVLTTDVSEQENAEETTEPEAQTEGWKNILIASDFPSETAPRPFQPSRLFSKTPTS